MPFMQQTSGCLNFSADMNLQAFLYCFFFFFLPTRELDTVGERAREKKSWLIVMPNLRVNDTITMPTLTIAMETSISRINSMEKNRSRQGVVGMYACVFYNLEQPPERHLLQQFYTHRSVQMCRENDHITVCRHL
ncbi:hypothetical protein CHARACLAT_020939 [Characodon lateralis]|uniref:Uncharacterized protein n=1 Tax=Characodon lateralis TaxID=208331 RepID=A0ABU7DWF1_9TELE|nr:hypothetical protein [Characodon lateralis]